MPSIPQDIDKLLRNTEFFFRYLPIKNMYTIGPESVAEKIQAQNDSRIIFINENEFVDVQAIRQLYSSQTNKNPGRFGWYVQQFIKMQFAAFTNDEYYLIWDSDTIPLKPVNMFADDGRPFFDMKTEYHVPYFETINRIFHDIHKTAEGSFISEHMIVKTEYMRELIGEVEANTDLEGKNFQEKIMSAVNAEDLCRSGFSEFETFGSYVSVRHNSGYDFRKWHSLRSGGRFYRASSDIDERNIKWLSSKYDAISLEKWNKPSKLAGIVRSKPFQMIFSPSILESKYLRRL